MAKVGARTADRWHRGLPVTFRTTEGEVTVDPPPPGTPTWIDRPEDLGAWDPEAWAPR